MMKINRLLLTAGVAMALGFATTTLQAQDNKSDKPDAAKSDSSGRSDRGGPEAMRQRMLDHIREQMDVKSDDEWKIISERVSKVMEARRETMSGLGMGFRGSFGRSSQDSSRSRVSSFMPQPSPEEEALQKAIEDKASADDLKAKLAKVRAVRKEKEARLEKAQEDLKKVLTVKQEAVAVMNGLLK